MIIAAPTDRLGIIWAHYGADHIADDHRQNDGWRNVPDDAESIRLARRWIICDCFESA